MRKLFLHIGVSVDGYIEDENRQLDWPADEEWTQYISELLGSIGGQIYGRVAHQSLAQFWPTVPAQPDAGAALVEMAKMMEASPKYVVTRHSYVTDWTNSHVIRGDVAEEIRKLKNLPGKDLALFAGANLAQSVMEMGLFDEYRLVVNPIRLGGGTSLFRPGLPREKFALVNSRRFASGLLALTYAPADREPSVHRSAPTADSGA